MPRAYGDMRYTAIREYSAHGNTPLYKIYATSAAQYGSSYVIKK